jgi:hypothetical protein
MKIAYDHRIFCGQRYGGISRYFSEIATRIGRIQDCEVKIYAPLSHQCIRHKCLASVRRFYTRHPQNQET